MRVLWWGCQGHLQGCLLLGPVVSGRAHSTLHKFKTAKPVKTESLEAPAGRSPLSRPRWSPARQHPGTSRYRTPHLKLSGPAVWAPGDLQEYQDRNQHLWVATAWNSSGLRSAPVSGQQERVLEASANAKGRGEWEWGMTSYHRTEAFLLVLLS